jgi:hypothetical protein
MKIINLEEIRASMAKIQSNNSQIYKEMTQILMYMQLLRSNNSLVERALFNRIINNKILILCSSNHKILFLRITLIKIKKRMSKLTMNLLILKILIKLKSELIYIIIKYFTNIIF